MSFSQVRPKHWNLRHGLLCRPRQARHERRSQESQGELEHLIIASPPSHAPCSTWAKAVPEVNFIGGRVWDVRKQCCLLWLTLCRKLSQQMSYFIPKFQNWHFISNCTQLLTTNVSSVLIMCRSARLASPTAWPRRTPWSGSRPSTTVWSSPARPSSLFTLLWPSYLLLCSEIYHLGTPQMIHLSQQLTCCRVIQDGQFPVRAGH